MEGWFTDPYERHQARWMSQGTPTSLVRDGNVQSSDPPAQGSFSVNPVIVEAAFSPQVADSAQTHQEP
jgi:hypothetical protein